MTMMESVPGIDERPNGQDRSASPATISASPIQPTEVSNGTLGNQAQPNKSPSPEIKETTGDFAFLDEDRDFLMHNYHASPARSEPIRPASQGIRRAMTTNHSRYHVQAFNVDDGTRDRDHQDAINRKMQRELEQLRKENAHAQELAEDEAQKSQTLRIEFEMFKTKIIALEREKAVLQEALREKGQSLMKAELSISTLQHAKANTAKLDAEHIATLRRNLRVSEMERENERAQMAHMSRDIRGFKRLSHSNRRELQRRLAGADEARAKVERDLGALQHDNARLKDQNGKLMKRIASAAANSNKVSDEDIQHNWRKLSYNIDNLVHTLLNRPFEDVRFVEVLGGRLIDEMGKDAPNFTGDIKNDDTRPALLQAYIWRVIFDTAFSDQWLQSVWGGALGRQFKGCMANLVRAMPLHLQGRIASWRIEGATILEEGLGGDCCDEDAVNVVKDHIWKELAPFLQERVENSAESTPSSLLASQITELLRDAAHIQSVLMKSRAVFAVTFPVGECSVSTRRMSDLNGLAAYDADTMDDMGVGFNDNPEPGVNFVVSPMVYKTGSADGHGYDTTSIIAKAKVVCA